MALHRLTSVTIGVPNADETAAAAWEDCISEVPCRSCAMWS